MKTWNLTYQNPDWDQELQSRKISPFPHQVGDLYPAWLLDKWREEDQERARLAAYHANSA